MQIPSRTVVFSAQNLAKWWANEWTGDNTQIKSYLYLPNTFDTEIKIETTASTTEIGQNAVGRQGLAICYKTQSYYVLFFHLCDSSACLSLDGNRRKETEIYWNKVFANTLKVSSSSLEKVDSVSQESRHHNWTATISTGETLILQKKKKQKKSKKEKKKIKLGWLPRALKTLAAKHLASRVLAMVNEPLKLWRAAISQLLDKMNNLDCVVGTPRS